MIQVNPNIHSVREVPFAEFLRKTFPELPSIFVYFHLKNKKWIIAFWTNKDKRLAQEVYVIGATLSNISRELITYLKYHVLNPLTMRELTGMLDKRDSRTGDVLQEIVDEDSHNKYQLGNKMFSAPGGR